jgi:hypothetical protein
MSISHLVPVVVFALASAASAPLPVRSTSPEHASDRPVLASTCYVVTVEAKGRADVLTVCPPLPQLPPV